MEGFCRASSPPSIADSAPFFNENGPETESFQTFRAMNRWLKNCAKYLSVEGLRGN